LIYNLSLVYVLGGTTTISHYYYLFLSNYLFVHMSNPFNNDTIVSPEKLWENFISGDMVSFRQLYQLHYDFLFTYGLKYVSQEEIEDSIQNLFLYLLQNRSAISKIKDVKSYLFISLRNNIFKILKKKYKHVEVNDNEFVILEEYNEDKENLFEELVKLLKKLSPREYEIVQLKYYQGYKNMEIATLLNLDYQTVRNTLGNAIKKMRVIG